MVFILDGCSFHYAHVWCKTSFFPKKNRIWLLFCNQMPSTNRNPCFTPYVHIVIWATIWYKNHGTTNFVIRSDGATSTTWTPSLAKFTNTTRSTGLPSWCSRNVYVFTIQTKIVQESVVRNYVTFFYVFFKSKKFTKL